MGDLVDCDLVENSSQEMKQPSGEISLSSKIMNQMCLQEVFITQHSLFGQSNTCSVCHLEPKLFLTQRYRLLLLIALYFIRLIDIIQLISISSFMDFPFLLLSALRVSKDSHKSDHVVAPVIM